jgi:hypothetical protein
MVGASARTPRQGKEAQLPAVRQLQSGRVRVAVPARPDHDPADLLPGDHVPAKRVVDRDALPVDHEAHPSRSHRARDGDDRHNESLGSTGEPWHESYDEPRAEDQGEEDAGGRPQAPIDVSIRHGLPS